LICYTPSRGVISSRGLWPLYVTCDVVVPLTRTVEDMLAVLEVITQPDLETIGDFWRDQCTVTLPKALNLEGDLSRLCDAHSLRGKRLAVPKCTQRACLVSRSPKPHSCRKVSGRSGHKPRQTSPAREQFNITLVSKRHPQTKHNSGPTSIR
jgi:Asp-tRNA(Asn)/Glu-tRNA(Gln) amidotransferase A subunit family amidase